MDNFIVQVLVNCVQYFRKKPCFGGMGSNKKHKIKCNIFITKVSKVKKISRKQHSANKDKLEGLQTKKKYC